MENKFTREIEAFENEILDNYFDFSKEDSFLTHYTSSNGLEKILKSKCLWFSYYKYLNDESEGKIIYEVLDFVLDECKEIDNSEFKESVKEVVPTNSNGSPLRRFLNVKKTQKYKMIREFFYVVFPRMMIVCLCGITIQKIKIVKDLI